MGEYPDNHASVTRLAPSATPILSLPHLADDFDDELDRELAACDILAHQSLGRCDFRTAAVAQSVMHSGGKRVRSRLVLLACRTLRSVNPRARAAAAAIEMVHNASLIHDDILDNSDERRGAASLHVSEGVARAVLVGDLLYTRALNLLSEQGDAAAVPILTDALAQMAAGELRQREIAHDLTLPFGEYLAVIHAKTGSLISAALAIGALAADASAEQVDALAVFGHGLGSAFQMLDDIADYERPPERLGRAAGNDAMEGRVTVPLLLAFKAAPPTERARLAELFGAVGGDAQAISDLRDEIHLAGGFQSARALAKQTIADALPRLLVFPDSAAKGALIALALRLAAES
jgi:octaprenyl-diphosphate synthase